MPTNKNLRARQKEWARRNPEKVKEAKRRHRAKPEAKTKAAAQARAWRAKNRDAIKAQRKAREAAHPEKVHAQKLRAKLRVGGVGDPARHRRSGLAAKYNLTVDEYARLLSSQGGLCAICGAAEANSKGHALCVDHCHSCGKVRGLLCNRCNSALGYFLDEPERLRRAANYIDAGCFGIVVR